MAQEENKKTKEDKSLENTAEENTEETSTVEEVKEDIPEEVVEESVEEDKKVVEDENKDTTEEKIDSEESVGEDVETDQDEELIEENIPEETEIVEEVEGVEEGLPDFQVGDTVRVSYKIIEGDKTRTQPFQGIVISKKGSDISKTFTVRKIGADSIGVERIFPLHSPNIDKVEIVKRGKVRRAKLYYLRDRVGRKATRIKEKIVKDKS